MSNRSYIKDFSLKRESKQNGKVRDSSLFHNYTIYDLSEKQYIETNDNNVFLKFVEQEKDNLLVFQFNSDLSIESELARKLFHSNDIIYELIKTIDLDFCFNPIINEGELLIFNMRIIEDIQSEDILTKLVQICILPKCVLIINSNNNTEIAKMLRKNLNLKKTTIKTESTKDNDLHGKAVDSFREVNDSIYNKFDDFFDDSFTSNPEIITEMKDGSFQISQIVFWVFSYSLNKLEKFQGKLEEDCLNLCEIDYSEKFKFLSKIHQFEISVNLMKYELQEKVKFVKYCQRKILIFDKSGFFFREHFTTLFEILMEKLNSIEKKNKRFKVVIRKMKENFSEASEFTQHHQTQWLNKIMKALAIIATIFAPGNVVADLWGMNVTVPFQDVDSLLPFWILCLFIVFLTISHLYFFRWLGWF